MYNLITFQAYLICVTMYYLCIDHFTVVLFDRFEKVYFLAHCSYLLQLVQFFYLFIAPLFDCFVFIEILITWFRQIWKRS